MKSLTRGLLFTPPARKTGSAVVAAAENPAWAYRFGDNTIVEDENGEVIRRYKLPKPRRAGSSSRRGSTFENWAGSFGGKKKKIDSALQNTQTDDDNDDAKTVYSDGEDKHRDKCIHFRMRDERGRKMTIASRSGLPSQARELADTLRASATRGEKELLEVPPTEPATGRSKNSSDGPASPASRSSVSSTTSDTYQGGRSADDNRDEETAAEGKRREAALGITANEESDGDDENPIRSPGIRFADQPRSPGSGLAPRGTTLSWGKDVVIGKGKGKE